MTDTIIVGSLRKIVSLGLITGVFATGCFLIASSASAAGPKDGSVFAGNVTGIGTVDWSNASGAEDSDNSYASAELHKNETTRYLKVTDFDFDIPAGATINGIKVEVKRRADNSNHISDGSVRLVKAGVVTGSDKKITGSDWPTTDTYITYGSSSDLWGQAWSASDINDANFGFVIAALHDNSASLRTAKINHIRMTVFYTPATTLTVSKVCVPSNDTGKFNLRIDGATAGTGSDARCGGTTGAVIVTATSHTVSELAGTGTDLSHYTSVMGGDCAADGTVALSTGQAKVCTITNTKKPGEIHGMKFEDLNGNGRKDDGEPGLAGWIIELKKDGHTVVTAATDQSGRYSFFDIFADVYTIDEVGQTGWTQTASHPDPITVNPGEVINDIDFGNFHEATITGLKWDDTNGNGQRDDNEGGIPNWPVEIRRVIHEPVENIALDTEIVQLSLTGGDGGFRGTAPTPGHYLVTEQAQSGWQQTYPVESFFDIFVEVSGQTINTGILHGCEPTLLATCSAQTPITFGNFKLITITVEKDVVAPAGGPAADPHAFKITLDGGSEQTISENSPHVFENIGPGSHTLAEIGDPDFDLLAIRHGQTLLDNGKFTPNSGQDMTIVVTNKQKQGTLTVIKHVINHDGIGTAQASDFAFSVNGGGFVPFTADEENPLNGKNVRTLDPGTYTVTETAIGGYAQIGYDHCADMVLPSRGTATCMITNSDLPAGEGALTVIKHVINDNGGTAGAADFSLTISEEPGALIPVTSSEAMFLGPGLYAVDEGAPVSGYTRIGTASCTKDGSPIDGSTVSIEADHVYVCTITNDDNAPSLTLVKHVINDNGGTAVAEAWTLKAQNASDADLILTGSGTAASGADFKAGTYILSESGGSEGYAAGAWSCEGVQNDGDHITLGLGQTATCTITNDDEEAHLTIVKHAVGADGTFGFAITSTSNEFLRTLGLETKSGVATSEVLSLNRGTYDVTENAQNGWRLTDVSCVYNGAGVGQLIAGQGKTIAIGNGDSVVCTFTNERTISVSGMKWNDKNANTTREEEEPGLAGWAIRATPETSEGGSADSQGSRAVKTTATDSNGSYNFLFGPSDLGWWRIWEVAQDGWQQTYPAQSFFDVFVDISTNPDELANKNFGNHQKPAPPSTPQDNSSSTSANSGGGASAGGGGIIASSKLGDINNDGKVDILDFNILIIFWGKHVSGGASQGDLNGDGVVDLFDFNILMIGWGK